MKRCLHIGGILSDLLEKHRAQAGAELTRIRQVWTTVAGVAVAENAQPVAYHKRVLFVNVTCAVWIQQLQFLKEDLRARLQEALGDTRGIADIKFKIGPL